MLARLRAVGEAHSGLLRTAEGRARGWREQLQFHRVEREARLLETWLAGKVAAAESQDHGQDLEAVEVSLPWVNLGKSGLRLKGAKEVCGPGREEVRG